MIVLVTGGRFYNNAAQLKRVLDEVLSWSPTNHITVINGGAIGADIMSSMWAKERSERYREYKIAQNKVQADVIGAKFDWETHGNAAGPLRNEHMLTDALPDQGVVFDGGGGTLDMMTRLFAAKVNTWVVGRDV